MRLRNLLLPIYKKYISINYKNQYILVRIIIYIYIYIYIYTKRYNLMV